jgi:hypothetical protein
MGSIRYPVGMTTEVLLEKSVRYDRGGNPVEVVIPYEQFIDFIEAYGLDLAEEEKISIREAQSDRKAGRHENFIGADDAKRELGI